MMIVMKSLGRSAILLGCVLASAGPAFAQSSPSPFTSGVRYDIERRVVGQISPDPDGAGPLGFAAVRKTYDNQGRVIKVEAGELSSWQSETVAPDAWGTAFTMFRKVDTAYDAVGRKLKDVTTAGGAIQSVTQVSYDIMDRMVCTAVRMNPATFASPPTDACALGTAGNLGPDRISKTSYYAPGWVSTIQKAYGTPLQQTYAAYSYLPSGKLASVTDANGNLATMTYDTLDRQTRWTFPSKTTVGQVNATDYEEYGYDANGNRLTLRKRDGRTITYSYDAVNRAFKKDIPDSSALDVYTGYDNRGLPLSVRFGSTSGAGLTNVFDSLGRPISSTDNTNGTARLITYQWDANGNRMSVTHPDANYFVYDYDGLDRPTTIKENGGLLLAAFTYDNQGRRSSLARGGGVAATSYGYDPASRLASLTDDLGGTSADLVSTFTYSPASQIISTTRSNDIYIWMGGYNVNRPYTANGLNQYSVAGPATFTYDPNGNLTSDGGMTLTYDVENRLTAATGAKVVNLGWDPLGRLASTSGGSGGTVNYLYDGDELIAEYNSSGTLLRRYIHGADADDPLVWYEGPTIGTNRRYLQTDHQGSVVSIADASGTPLATNSYDPWGIPASTNIGRFQYTGQAYIPELGMYHYKARIYSPTLGRFLQTDPIGYEGGINMYAYVDNDPINRRDPTGLTPEEDDAKRARAVVTTSPVKEPAVNKADKPGEGGGNFGSCRGGNCDRTHKGIDLTGKKGDAVKAAGNGTVARSDARDSKGYGNQVVVKHADGVTTKSAHLDTREVKVGDKVATGQQIGTMGRSGNTPPQGDTHLHFEVRVDNRAIDPASVIPDLSPK